LVNSKYTHITNVMSAKNNERIMQKETSHTSLRKD